MNYKAQITVVSIVANNNCTTSIVSRTNVVDDLSLMKIKLADRQRLALPKNKITRSFTHEEPLEKCEI